AAGMQHLTGVQVPGLLVHGRGDGEHDLTGLLTLKLMGADQPAREQIDPRIGVLLLDRAHRVVRQAEDRHLGVADQGRGAPLGGELLERTDVDHGLRWCLHAHARVSSPSTESPMGLVTPMLIMASSRARTGSGAVWVSISPAGRI